MMRTHIVAQVGCGLVRPSALALGLVLLVATATSAAVVTITDCVNDPHIVSTENVSIDVGTDDLVLRCNLERTGSNSRIIIRAANMEIDGNIVSGIRTKTIDIKATGKLVVDGVEIAARAGSGGVKIAAGGDIIFDNAAVSAGTDDQDGRFVSVACTGKQPVPCTITARQSSFSGARAIDVLGAGDIYFVGTKVTSSSPRDRITVVTEGGDAIMRGCGNLFQGGSEGSLDLTACGLIDLAFAKVLVSRNITITSGTCEGKPANIRLNGATVRNDSGQKGEIVVVATGGQEINISGATIIDDNQRTKVNDVARLNGREAVPHEGFNNVVGTPDADD